MDRSGAGLPGVSAFGLSVISVAELVVGKKAFSNQTTTVLVLKQMKIIMLDLPPIKAWLSAFLSGKNRMLMCRQKVAWYDAVLREQGDCQNLSLNQAIGTNARRTLFAANARRGMLKESPMCTRGYSFIYECQWGTQASY
jgi:hypothetical protein